MARVSDAAIERARERFKAMNRDPVFAAKRDESSRKALLELYADQARMRLVNTSRSETLKKRWRDPNKRPGLLRHGGVPAWVPDDLIVEYRDFKAELGVAQAIVRTRGLMMEMREPY